jgi:hypothetical protein
MDANGFNADGLHSHCYSQKPTQNKQKWQVASAKRVTERLVGRLA